MKRIIAVLLILAAPALAMATALALLLCTSSAAWATGTDAELCPDVCSPCPDCVCNPAPCKCDGLQCPDVNCPACPDCPDCSLTCPDPCPVIDDDASNAGVYTMIGIGGGSSFGTSDVTLGTFTLYGKGDIGFGYQCIIAGGTDRRGCQAYMLRRR